MWNIILHIVLPAYEVKMLDKTYRLDGHLIKQRHWIARLDIKDCCNHTTNPRANIHDAVHAHDLTKPFNHSLQYLTMRFDEIEHALILCYLLSFAMRFDLHNVALTNKAQDGDGACLKIQGIKICVLNIATQ